jgi:HEPN domain-containing protein
MKLYGLLIQQKFIDEFKRKNDIILNVLAEENIPIRIDSNSKVIENEFRGELPQEITSILNNIKQGQQNNDPLINLADEVKSRLPRGNDLNSGKSNIYIHNRVEMPPSEYIDLQLLRNNANGLRKAAKRLQESRPLPNNKIEAFLIPAVVNLASSIEYYLKFLLAKKGKSVSTHRLLDLYKELDLAMQNDILRTVKYNKNAFELKLLKHSDTAIEWQNIHIYGKNKSMFVDIQFLTKLSDSLELITNPNKND